MFKRDDAGGPPAFVKIGPVDYKLILDSSLQENFGECDTALQVIHISVRQTAQAASDTLLHEILHAIWDESGLFMHKRPSEETIVRTVSTWLRMVLRDNPAVARLIVDAQAFEPFVSPEAGAPKASGRGRR